MLTLSLKNHFFYWVDRYDHILDDNECNNAKFLGFLDIIEEHRTTSLWAEYQRAEVLSKKFIEALVAYADPALAQTQVRYSLQTALSKEMAVYLNKRQIATLEALMPEEEEEEEDVDEDEDVDEESNDDLPEEEEEEEEQEITASVQNSTEFWDLVELGIREILELEININGVYVQFGFDMAIIVQNVPEADLLQLAAGAQLHVIKKWEHSGWGYEEV